MFRLRQALAKIVNFCSDWPTGLKKNQICSNCAVRSQKWPILFGLGHQASKMANYAWIAPKQQLDSQPQAPNYNLSHPAST